MATGARPVTAFLSTFKIKCTRKAIKQTLCYDQHLVTPVTRNHSQATFTALLTPTLDPSALADDGQFILLFGPSNSQPSSISLAWDRCLGGLKVQVHGPQVPLYPILSKLPYIVDCSLTDRCHAQPYSNSSMLDPVKSCSNHASLARPG